jgi:hypothetical protein
MESPIIQIGILVICTTGLAWFYGAEQSARQTRFFSLIKAGRFTIVGDGRNRRSMGYSLAYGILLAAATPKGAGRIHWLADPRPYGASLICCRKATFRSNSGVNSKRGL